MQTRRFQVPDPEEDFGGEGEGDFISAPELENVAYQLLLQEQFRNVMKYEPSIRVLWKQAGGASGGRNTLGKCKKVAGELKFFAGEYDFLIWLAADHCQNLDDSQIEAVLFHELCHIGVNPKTGAFVITPHDYEGFASEIREYGANVPGVRGIARAVQSSFIKEA